MRALTLILVFGGVAVTATTAFAEDYVLRDKDGRRIGIAQERYDGHYTLRDRDGRRIGSIDSHRGSDLRPTDNYHLRSQSERQVDRILREQRYKTR